MSEYVPLKKGRRDNGGPGWQCYTTDYNRIDCGPFKTDDEEILLCPLGFDMSPHPCWNCGGTGCKYCENTGMMSPCKACKATEAISNTILWYMENKPDYTIEVIEEKVRAKYKKQARKEKYERAKARAKRKAA